MTVRSRTGQASRPLFLLLSAALLACSPIAGRTFEPGVEYLPAPGSFHVEGEPATADRALTVRFFGPSGVLASISDDFVAGDVIRIDRTDHPGEHGLAVNGARCAGRFTVEAGRETDVVLRFNDAGCETTIERVHDEGVVVHEEISGLISGFAPIGATIEIVSMDTPPRHARVTLLADESGAFAADPLPPGRYRVGVLAQSGPASVTVALAAGESEHVDLRVMRGTAPPS